MLSKVAISIDREYDNYGELRLALEIIAKSEGFTEFCSLESDIIKRYRDDTGRPVQLFKIDWKVYDNTPKDLIKNNKLGKPYNSGAPAIAAKKLVDYATDIIIFGKGDYNINKMGKSLKEILLTKKAIADSKRYKF